VILSNEALKMYHMLVHQSFYEAVWLLMLKLNYIRCCDPQ